MEEIALKRAQEWVNNKHYDQASRDEIKTLLDKKDNKEIIDRFYKDLEFGTGGIRGVIGAGINRMNRYNVMKATQALAQTVLGSGKKEHRVAISYDSRRFSLEFAKITAEVLAGNGIQAFIYKRLNPVCLLSWSVRFHKATAGVMITASHNPPQYNGYKVYWDDGCQVTAPHDQAIIDAYYKLNDMDQVKTMDFDLAVRKELIVWVDEHVEQKYIDTIATTMLNPKLIKEKGHTLGFVYTPIHGSGFVPVTSVLNKLGFTNYLVVEEQKLPDGNFPTVTSPNPENASALKLAVELMNKNNMELVFGTDPDADRIGVAVKHQGEVHYLSGNQIGTLLLEYICKTLSEQKKLPKKPYAIKSIVTTELQSVIAKHYGVEMHNTLTGFKWICGLMREFETKHPDRTFIFGTEESFGYLNHPNVRDKDGVAPVALLAEMALWYKQQNMTLIDALNSIYEKHGFSLESLLNLDYFGADGAAKINRIMERFRKADHKEIIGLQVAKQYDYQSQMIQNRLTNTTEKISLPKSNVLSYHFASNDVLFLRPSGTEPKIKFYIMVAENQGDLKTRKQKAKEKTDRLLEWIKKEAEQA